MALIAIALALAWPDTQAQMRPEDRDAPMEIEADSLSHDELQGITIATGNVVVTKGSMRLKALRVTIKQDVLGYRTVLADGSAEVPAYFYQKSADASEADIEAYGEKIFYDGNLDEIQLINHAVFRRILQGVTQDEAKGKRIIYNNILDTYCVESEPGQCGTHSPPDLVDAQDTKSASAKDQDSKRVRVVIGPRP